MKVYFSVIGIGLGHITRCMSVADQLSREGIECVFSSYGKAAEVSRQKGYETYTGKPLMWYENELGHVDFERSILCGLLLFKRIARHYVEEDRLLKKLKPDLVVCDSRYSTIPASKNLNVPRVYITNQPRVYMPRTNNGHDNGSGYLEYMGSKLNYSLLSGHDSILLPDFPLPYSVSERHMRFQECAPRCFVEKTRFVGPISSTRPGHRTEEEIEDICSLYDVTPGEFVYIAFSGPGVIMKSVKGSLISLFKDYETPSVMGTGEPGATKVHHKGNLRLVRGWIDDRDALIQGAKVVISRAGLSTLSELLVYGKRAVVIPQGNQPEQESNSHGMEKLGSAKSIYPGDVNPDSLREILTHVEHSREIGRSAERVRSMAARWKGEENSAKIILELLEAT